MTDAYEKMRQGAGNDMEAIARRQEPNTQRVHEEEARDKDGELPRDGRRYDGRDVRRLKEDVGE